MINKNKGFTLIEVVASLAILSIVAVGVFTFIGKQNITLSKLETFGGSYDEAYYDLQKATLVDNELDGSLSSEYENETEIDTALHTVTVNDIDIDFELFTATNVLVSGEVMHIFIYNFTNEVD